MHDQSSLPTYTFNKIHAHIIAPLPLHYSQPPLHSATHRRRYPPPPPKFSAPRHSSRTAAREVRTTATNATSPTPLAMAPVFTPTPLWCSGGGLL